MASSYDISAGTGRLKLEKVDGTYVALQVSSSLDLDSDVTIKIQQTSDGIDFFDLEGTDKIITSISPTDTNYNIPDSSTNARNGVTANMVTSDLKEEYAGDGFYNTKSLYFDGSDNYVKNIGIPSDWNFIKNTFIGTISFWFKHDNYNDSTFRYILGTGINGTDKGWFVNYNGTTSKFNLSIGNGSSTILSNVSSFTIADNDWHHVAIVANASNVKWYLDSVYGGTGTGGFGTADTGDCNEELHIGDIPSTGNSPFTGNISEVSIFSSELLQANVDDLYNSGNPRTVLSNSEVANLELYQHYDYATNFNQTDSSYIESYDYTLNQLYLYVDTGSATIGTLNIFLSPKKKEDSNEVDATIIGTPDVDSNITNAELDVNVTNTSLPIGSITIDSNTETIELLRNILKEQKLNNKLLNKILN